MQMDRDCRQRGIPRIVVRKSSMTCEFQAVFHHHELPVCLRVANHGREICSGRWSISSKALWNVPLLLQALASRFSFLWSKCEFNLSSGNHQLRSLDLVVQNWNFKRTVPILYRYLKLQPSMIREWYRKLFSTVRSSSNSNMQGTLLMSIQKLHSKLSLRKIIVEIVMKFCSWTSKGNAPRGPCRSTDVFEILDCEYW